MKYKDPIYGEIELKLIEKFEIPDVGATRTQELYEMPSGDYIVFSEVTPNNLPNHPYKQQFFIRKEWVESINK